MSKGEERKAVEKELTLLTRDARLVIAYLFLNSVPIGYMNVIPLIYLIEIGYSPSTVSIIYAASAIANTIGLTPFGILADKYGRKKFLIIGSIIPAISYVIFGLTLDPYWLIIASTIGGVGFAGGLAVAVSGPALLPVVADTVSVEKRTNIFGAIQAVWTVALTIGAVLSLLPGLFQSQFALTDYFAHSLSYFIMAGFVVVSIVPLIFIQEKYGSLRERERQLIKTRSLEGLKHDQDSAAIEFESKRKRVGFVSGKEIKKFSVVYGLSGLGLGVSVQLIATWYNLRFGTTETVAGFWIGLAELVSAIPILLIPFLVRSRGTLQASVLTSLVSAVFLIAMPFANIFLLAAVLFVFRNIFVNISWPILQSYVMGVVDERERAAVTGIATTAWGLANSIGTVIGGALFASGLLSLPFVIGFAGYAGSALMLGFLFKGIKPPEEYSLQNPKIQ
jgi:MFS family permease